MMQKLKTLEEFIELSWIIMVMKPIKKNVIEII